MKNIFLIKTKNENYYLYNYKFRKFIFLHPVMYYLLELREKKIDLDLWIKNETFENKSGFSKSSIKYYKRKIDEFLNKSYILEQDFIPEFDGRLSESEVRANFVNCNEICFETTEACNMMCKYCAYGDLYNNYDPRVSKTMEFETAKNFIDYLVPLWQSNLYSSYNNNINISFFGGEPLLNFKLIEKVVDYTQNIKTPYNIKFTYGLTTNGLLLKKYIDYFLKYKFRLLISLDGNENNNSYRVFKNGKTSFKKIINNINHLYEKYPEYFRKYVSFNSVLHDKNSPVQIYNFFERKFLKEPMISSINPNGISPEKIDDFKKIYTTYYGSIKKDIEKEPTKNYMYTFLQKKNVMVNIENYLSNYIDNNLELLSSEAKLYNVPTGTCLPFGKRIYITANGKIIPCEKVGHNFVLGMVTNKKINIDYKDLADKYNRYYEHFSKYCSVCYDNQQCPYCIYGNNMQNKCTKIKTYWQKKEEYKNFLEVLEDNSQLLNEIL